MNSQSGPGAVSRTAPKAEIEGSAENPTTLTRLARDINRAHAEALEHARSAVQRARHAGELLLQAKKQVQHGVWLPWLSKSCPDIAERTAQAYMRLARHCLDKPEDAERIESMTLRTALTALATPKPEDAHDRRHADEGVRHRHEPEDEKRNAVALLGELDTLADAVLKDPSFRSGVIKAHYHWADADKDIQKAAEALVSKIATKEPQKRMHLMIVLAEMLDIESEFERYMQHRTDYIKRIAYESSAAERA